MKKIITYLLGILCLSLISCAKVNPPSPQPTPPGPIVNPTPPKPTPPPVGNGKVFVPEFGADSVAISATALTTYVVLSDTFSKVYADLKKPFFARGQTDGGVALIYKIEGSNQRAYFLFRGGDGLLIRIAQN